jgi:hypothetical protein
MQHRLSNKERPMSPELSSAFPEHVRAAEGDKEVVAYQQPQPLPYQRPADGSGGDGKRILGMRSKWFYGLLVPLIILVVLGIGLGVGLGVGLGNQKSQYVALKHTHRETRFVTNTKQLSDYNLSGEHFFNTNALTHAKC